MVKGMQEVAVPYMEPLFNSLLSSSDDNELPNVIMLFCQVLNLHKVIH